MSRKRIFAGKTNLQPEPFCPYLTNESGYISQRNRFNKQHRSAQLSGFRMFSGGGKSRFI